MPTIKPNQAKEVIDKDIKSQIERAKELLKELEESCKADLQSDTVSAKTENLTQEVLIKMRHMLDQSMRRFFEKTIVPNLSDDDKNKARVYFPIARNHTGFKSTLGRGKMVNLDVTHPDMYKFLESVQPYNANFNWLDDFSKFANEKHIRLSPQETKKENETMLSNAVRIGRGGKVAMRGCVVNGIPVNSEDINTTPLDQFDPRLNIKRTTWISFNFKGSDTNALWLCKKAVSELEKVVGDFFAKF